MSALSLTLCRGSQHTVFCLSTNIEPICISLLEKTIAIVLKPAGNFVWNQFDNEAHACNIAWWKNNTCTCRTTLCNAANSDVAQMSQSVSWYRWQNMWFNVNKRSSWSCSRLRRRTFQMKLQRPDREQDKLAALFRKFLPFHLQLPPFSASFKSSGFFGGCAHWIIADTFQCRQELSTSGIHHGQNASSCNVRDFVLNDHVAESYKYIHPAAVRLLARVYESCLSVNISASARDFSPLSCKSCICLPTYNCFWNKSSVTIWPWCGNRKEHWIAYNPLSVTG